MVTTEPISEVPVRVVIEPASGAAGSGVRLRRPTYGYRPQPIRCQASAPDSAAGLSLTNRARLILALIWLVLIGAGAVAFVYPWPGPESADVTMTVNVDVGDTLWDIAGEVAPAVDRRETVATIMDLNDLSSPRDIRVGDELLVPTRYAPQ